MWCRTVPAILLVLSVSRPALSQTSEGGVDVLNYSAVIRPDISARSVSGRVNIHLQFHSDNVRTVEFDRGELSIDEVRYQGQPVAFELPSRRLKVILPQPAARNSLGDFALSYHGTPRSGLQFVPERQQVYTIFSTSQWLVCVDAPDDKATLDLQVILPAGLLATGSGTLVEQRPGPDGTVVHRWQQSEPVSTYLFGFAAGRFTASESRKGTTAFRDRAESMSRDELNRIFVDTPDMVDFFTEHAGVPFPGKTYTQVLVANTAGQEAAGFSMLSDAYGRAVLNDPTAISLIAHELAHQWWGNLVTCRDWTHFWLNEGFATFMAAAYDERRFGPQAYRRDIERIRVRYDEVRQNGGDRPLVFPDWNHPSASDRTIVYQKGAYVLHVLREQLGDDAFWAGIRHYTVAHAGRSVTTEDFKRSMEESTGSDLGAFFDKWVYLKP
ncbi:MAG TPA: M1 family metallopeptidase [Vicinamibacterales bacterium]